MNRNDRIALLASKLPAGVRFDDLSDVAMKLVNAGFRASEVEDLLDDVIALGRREFGESRTRNTPMDCATTSAQLGRLASCMFLGAALVASASNARAGTIPATACDGAPLALYAAIAGAAGAVTAFVFFAAFLLLTRPDQPPPDSFYL
jgi:hypothetical protein